MTQIQPPTRAVAKFCAADKEETPKELEILIHITALLSYFPITFR